MATDLKEVFRITVKLAPPLDIGPVPLGLRRVIAIIGGTVTGERFNGEVLPIGADWNLIQSDGIMFVSARYLLKADDGAIVSILNEGWGRIDDGAMAKIMANEPAPAEGWYLKLHPRFEAADPKYRWLNESVFLCEMLPPPSADIVQLVIYEVL